MPKTVPIMKRCSWLEHCIGWRSGQDGHMHHAPHPGRADRRKKEKKKEMRRTLMEKSVGGGECVSRRGGEIEITHGVAVPCRAAAIDIHERHGLLDHTNIMTLREPEEMTAGSLARHSLDSIMG